MATASIATKEFAQVELDHIGQLYGVYRFDNESFEDFKTRILSVFVYPTSSSYGGYSSGASRAVGAYPVNIGYIDITSEEIPLVDYDSFRLLIDKDTFDINENISLLDIKNYLENENIGTIYVKDNKYLNKNITFFLPFINSSFRMKRNISAGINYINEKEILANSFISNSEYFLNQKLSIEDITKRGDYYFDSLTNRLIVYSDPAAGIFEITYAVQKRIIPLVYVPVKVVSLSNLEKINSTSLSTPDTLPDYYLDFLWNSLVNNNRRWKANADGAVSVNGTYYE